MARTYDTRTAAAVVDAPVKWIDNLLSHHSLPGIAPGRQGSQRQISEEALLAILMVRRMTIELGIPVRFAADIVRKIGPQSQELRYETLSGVALLFPRAALEALLRSRLLDAIESAPRPQRGRPPGSATRFTKRGASLKRSSPQK